MKIRKRAYVLLEICIALTLSALLLGILFSSYVHFYKVDAKLKIAKKQMLQRGTFSAVIQKTFLTVPHALVTANLPKAFYKQTEEEKNEQLIFVCDMGATPTPDFSGPVFGSLLVDEKNNLCLVFWPLDKSSAKVRKSVLIEKVDSLRFLFFTEKNKEFSWQSNTENMPLMVRVSFRQQKEPLCFVFFIPCVTPIIHTAPKKTKL